MTNHCELNDGPVSAIHNFCLSIFDGELDMTVEDIPQSELPTISAELLLYYSIVITTFPRFLPVITSRCALGTSASGYVSAT
jgi:hypothetical protein